MEGTELDTPTLDKDRDDDSAGEGAIHGSLCRASAAQALMALAAKETDAQQLDAIYKRIHSLTTDTVSAVRASVAGEVHLLWNNEDPSFAWEIIDHFVKEEDDPQVLKRLLESVGRLRGVELTRVTEAILSVYNRCKDSNDTSLRQTAAINLAFLYVDRGSSAAEQALKDVIDHPVERCDELERMIVFLRGRLIYGISEPSNAIARSVRERATKLLHEVLSQLMSGLSSWKARHANQQVSELTEKDKDELKVYRTNIENIAAQVYFASGAFDEQQGKDGLSESAKARFIEEQNDLISQIAAIGDVRSAHHFVEMALAYQDIDPIWAMKLVATSIASSVASGVASESLMVSSIATFVKQFIGRHRHYLRDKANQESLMSIVEAFMDIGWPEAVNLTQDLEEIFR